MHHVAVGDLNGDGDADVLYHDSHRMSFFAEASFLRSGYQWATVSRVERPIATERQVD